MSSVSEALNGDALHPEPPRLDFNTLKEVPDLYLWANLNAHSLSSVETPPVIDLTNIDAVELIGRACESWGMFQITNHGICMDLLHEVESRAKQLLMLPLEQKLKVAQEPGQMIGYGAARYFSFFKKLMWYEGFTVAGSPLEHARKLWPDDYKSFCDVMEEYQKEMNKLAHKLMRMLLTYLRIEVDDVPWVDATGEFQTSAYLTLNSYPPCPNPNQAIGAAEHTDSGVLTILHQTTSGLQVLKDGGHEWTPVHPVNGALDVNVGDLLHILSNGRFRNPIHRALVNENHRMTISYFWGPPATVEASPISKLVTNDHPQLYRSIRWSEFLRLKAQYWNEALSSIRLLPQVEQQIEANDKNNI